MAKTITLSPSADNYIEDVAATTNYGTSGSLYTGEYNGGAQIDRILIKFDLSTILSGARVTSAVLRIKDVGTDYTDNARKLHVYRCLRNWVETESTWNIYSTGNNWATAGCGNTTTDRDSTSLGNVTMPNPPVAGTYYEISLTADTIKQMIDGTVPNYGFVLVMATETNDMHRFYSRETATVTDRPELVITYEPGIKKINGVYMGSQEIASTALAGDANLVGYWRLEGNSTATVGTNGTDSNITYGAAYGKFGQGALFAQASSSKITIGDVAAYEFSGDFSISLWFNRSTHAVTNLRLISKGGDGTNDGFAIWSSNTTITTGIDGASAARTLSADVTHLGVGVWQHVVLVRSGTHQYTYLNGVLVNDVTASGGSTASAAQLLIGNYEDNNALAWNGSLDDVAIFNDALTSDEITSLYKTGVKKLNGQVNLNPEFITTSMFGDATNKAYYRFESGALTTDSSGNSHTLTAISDPAETTGKFGGGVDLDGNDAYSATDHADFKPTGNFSIGGWIKTSTANTIIFSSYSQNTNWAGIFLYISGGGKLICLSAKNNGTTQGTHWQQALGATTITDGNWHLVNGIYDGANLYVYVDGKLDGSTAWTSGAAYAATNYVRVGCYSTTGSDSLFFTGSLDDLFLLNGKALTATEISNLYNTNIKKYMGISNV